MEPGSPIDVVMSKWGDRPHWRFQGIHLGTDEHGEWLGFPRGTHYARPGMTVDARVDGVTLVAAGRPWLATFHAPGIGMEVYVDIATPPVWQGTTLRSVDLDLDVVRRADGTVFVDDEDEFAEHRLAFGYPADVVAMAERAAAEVLASVRGRVAPYDGTAAAWLDRLSARG